MNKPNYNNELLLDLIGLKVLELRWDVRILEIWEIWGISGLRRRPCNGWSSRCNSLNIKKYLKLKLDLIRFVFYNDPPTLLKVDVIGYHVTVIQDTLILSPSSICLSLMRIFISWWKLCQQLRIFAVFITLNDDHCFGN